MADIAGLKVALIKAHKKGDLIAANMFKDKIKAMQGSQQPVINQQPDPQRQVVEGDFIPTEENLAAAEASRQPQPDRSIGESLVGVGETALTALTGATGGAAGFISAVPGAVAGELTGRLEQGEGLAEASKRAADFT